MSRFSASSQAVESPRSAGAWYCGSNTPGRYQPQPLCRECLVEMEWRVKPAAGAKPAKEESPALKSEPHASTPMKTEPESSPPKLNADALGMDMDACDLFDMGAGVSSTTLDHATSKQASPTHAPSLHGDLNELRHMVDSRFKGFEKPHPSRLHASDSSASAATKNPPGRSLRLRTKSPPDSWIPPSTTMSMKRPAASSTMSATHDASSEWKVHQYERKDGSGKHYYTYESPDGSRYPSLKKARVNGYVS